MDLASSAVITGIALSLVFIGPVFFILIETSISKGWQQALSFDLGVIVCDLLFIFLFYFTLQDSAEIVNKNPSLEKYLYRIGAVVLLIYGLVLIFKKETFKQIRKRKRRKDRKKSDYFNAFMNGFLLNLMNVGVIFFWFGLVSYLSVEYPRPKQFLLFIGISFGTFFFLDLLKIFAARKLSKIVTDRFVIRLRQFMGMVLIVFSIILFARSYGAFDHLIDSTENMIENSPE